MTDYLATQTLQDNSPKKVAEKATETIEVN